MSIRWTEAFATGGNEIILWKKDKETHFGLRFAPAGKDVASMPRARNVNQEDGFFAYPLANRMAL
jgi:hypothetical protein